MIQSLLTQEEYDGLSKTFNTYNASKRRATKEWRTVKLGGQDFLCGPPPNYLMGNSYTPAEIKTINNRLDEVLKTVKT